MIANSCPGHIDGKGKQSGLPCKSFAHNATRDSEGKGAHSKPKPIPSSSDSQHPKIHGLLFRNLNQVTITMIIVIEIAIFVYGKNRVLLL